MTAETVVAVNEDDALSSSQQMRLDTLGYLIQLENIPTATTLADFKELLAETAIWVETGEWPAGKPKADLKPIRGGKNAGQ